MARQNRVTPFGEIVALDGRGLVLGNRGILHDDSGRIVRASQLRRWLACRLEFRGRRRQIMRPRSYTELFFLDEATAFSAGHRPCAECRHADYQRFRRSWEQRDATPASAEAIDAVLHAERLDKHKKRSYRAAFATLPDGAYVAINGAAWLVWDRALLAWSDSGYTQRRPRPARGEVDVLTPASIVVVFAAGYRPAIHPSAG